MKKLILSAALMMALSMPVFAQKSETPSDVIASFEQKFPNTQKVEWAFDEEDNLWEAEHVFNHTEYTSAFTPTGEWVETEKELKRKDLPQAVLTTLKSEFDDFDIEEVVWIETPEGTFYEVELEQEENGREATLELTLTPEGTVVKKESGDDEEDDE